MKNSVYAILSLLLLAAGCPEHAPDRQTADSVTIEQISYGVDTCEFSGELITTSRYGGRLVMKNGDVFNFMSVECLAGFYLNLPDRSEAGSLQVVDFTHGKRLLDVGEMIFLHSWLRPSPNGMYLTAIEKADEKMVTNIYDAYPGPLIEWEDVLDLVRNEWNLEARAAAAR